MTIRTALPALALTGALVLTGCGGDAPTRGAGTGSPPGSSSPTDSSAAPAPRGEDADVAFLQAMHPHHAQATEMAALAPGRTDDPDVLDLADQVQRAQGPEMERMTRLLASMGRPAPSAASGGTEGMDHGSGSMSGMMTEEDMASLRAASGGAFDRAWLTMMLEHHAGAVEMARTELEDGSDPRVRQLATEIVQGQEAEITTMEALLDRP